MFWRCPGPPRSQKFAKIPKKHEISHKIMQQKKPDFFVIATGESHSVKEFVQKSFAYVGLNYKKYLKIDKKFMRPSRTSSLVGDTTKAKKLLNYKVNTNFEKLISIMMDNDLEIEKDNN